ncbi:MAG: ATP12 family protein [Alphaproteobacteria bacterium]
MRRFWETVSIVAIDDGGGHGVALDSRPIKTPARHVLQVPTAALAAAIADEWRSQGETVAPATMPQMTFACTAIDRVAPQREAVIDEIAGFAGTDLLCYRADEAPVLVERQTAHWQPVLDWAAVRFDATLAITAGVVPVRQSAAALAAVRHAVAANDDMCLAALHAVTSVTGSVVLGLALVEGPLDAARVSAASLLDERFQAERWGEDDEATARRAALEAEIANVARFLILLKTPKT